MARHAVAWLERRDLLARTVTIKVRYSDFTTITRSHTAPPSRDTGDLAMRAVQLLQKTAAGQRPVRLLGVSVHNLCTPVEVTNRVRRLASLSDRLVARCLHQVIVQGDIMLDRLAPLRSGRDTEIDMIEREMEGGVVVIQPLEVHEHYVEEPVGGSDKRRRTRRRPRVGA